MKTRKVSLALRVLMICFMAAILFVGTASTVKASESSKKKKHENCYLNYVKIKADGQSHTIRGSLKPIGVDSDITWENYFSNISVEKYQLVAANNCVDEDDHNLLIAYINVNKQWSELFIYDRLENKVYYQYDGMKLDANFYDVKFGFSNRASDYTSTGLYVRFSRTYKIFYELGGGKFENGTLDSYALGADYTVPTPTRAGYEFVGWTGTGLTAATKNVVIKNGSTGNKKFTAVWKSTAKPVTPPAKTTVKSASKKLNAKAVKVSLKKINGAAGYSVQFSTTKKFKNVLVSKTVNKINVTIKHKSLKNKKKLYVRAKAYKLDGRKKFGLISGLQ